MTGDELLLLNRVSHLTPRQLADQPAARALFVRLASGRLRRELAGQLGAVAPELHERVMGLEMADELDGGRDLRLRLEEQAKDLGSSAQKEARARLSELERSGLLRSPWKPDTPLRDHPLLGATMARAEVQAIGALARLSDEEQEALGELARSAASIDAPLLARLVRTRKLSEDDAAKVAHFATLYHMVDGRVALIEALEKKEETAPRHLARKDSAAWVATLTAANEVPPAGKSVLSWAQELARRYAVVCPTDALLSRLALDGLKLGTYLKTASPADQRRIVNRYPGLELRPLLFKGGAKASERAAWVAERVSLLERLREGNPDAELLALDLGPGSSEPDGILAGGLAPADRAMAIECLRVYQRVLRIVPGEPERARVLVEHGFDSAAAIVRAGVDRFVAAVDLGDELGRRIYDRARDLAIHGVAVAGALLDAPVGERRLIDAHDVLGRGQTGGSCTRCQSLSGEPAYFADLLAFVEERVLEPVFGEQPDHARSLRTRRGDLFTLPLSCATLDEKVPVLDVVNELLERAGASAGPGHAERLEELLGVLGSSRADVAAAAGVTELWPMALRLSPSEAERLCTPVVDPTELSVPFGQSVRVQGDGLVAPLDVTILRATLSLGEGELELLLASRFVSGDGEPRVVGDRLEGATLSLLDRLRRVSMLRRRFPWSVAELDQALTAVGAQMLGSDDLGALLRLRALDGRLGLGLEETCAVVGKLGRGGLFDRLFNLPQLVASGGAWPKEQDRFIHPSLRADRTRSEPDLPRLLAALRVSDEELAALIHALAFWLNFDPEAEDEEERGFLLTRANLAVLHRHARLCRHTGRSVPELFQLIKLAGVTAGAVQNLADVEAVLDLHAWLQRSGVSTDELAFITGRRVLRPERLPVAAAIARELAERTAPVPVPHLAHDAISRMLLGEVKPRPTGDVLAALLGVSPEKLETLAGLVGVDASDATEGTIAAILPLLVLFKNPVFDDTAILFLAARASSFGASFDALDVTAVRRLHAYAGWIDDGAPAADVQAVLSGSTDAATHARALASAPSLLAALRARLKLPAIPSEAFGALARAAALARRLGVGGDTLGRAASSDEAEMGKAADALLASLRARHASDEAFRDELAPVLDRLREVRRDALVASLGKPVVDVNAMLLLDVRGTGAARATRLELALFSVCDYIERCRSGREDDVPASVISDADWAWRRTHAAWKARRQVFLDPGRALSEERRSDRTPPFEAFAAELARPDLTDAHVAAAVAHYVRALEELSALEIAGVFHEHTVDPDRDRLHVFGTRAGRLYHRALDHVEASARDLPSRARVAGPWRAVELPVAARRVAPIVLGGRPYLFWAEYRTRPRHEGRELTGYRHELQVRFSYAHADGTWAPPADLTLGEGAAFDDALNGEGIPRFDTLPHLEAREDYRPRGAGWDEVSVDLDAANGALVLTGRNDSEALYRVVDLVRRDARGWPATFWGYQPPLAPSVQLLCARRGSTRKLFAGRPPGLLGTRDAAAGLFLDEARIDALRAEAGDRVRKDGLYARELCTLDAGDELTPIRGSFTDAILDHKGDLLLLQSAVAEDGAVRLTRLSTTMVDAVATRFLSHGVAGLYAPAFRGGLGEAALDLSTTAAVDARVPDGAIDLGGAYGVYWRELFIHLPLLAAERLAAAGRHDEAALWLGRVYVPEVGFADAAALEAYRRAPEDAHAVARLRPRALAAHLRARRGGAASGPASGPRCAYGAAGGGSVASTSPDLAQVHELLATIETALCARALAGARKTVATGPVIRPRMEPLRMAHEGARAGLSSFGPALPAEADGDASFAFGWSVLRALVSGYR